jgi:ribonuclease E
VAESDSDLESFGERSSGFSFIDSASVTPKVLRGGSLSEELGIGGRSSMFESPAERVAKPQLVRTSRETEPPEVIAIEMTPEEQDVYAFMGISPLVRLNREVKNPKSVILSVVLPGESGQTETIPDSSVELSTDELSLSERSDEGDRPEMSSLPISLPLSNEAPTTEIAIDPTPPSDSDSNPPLIRRRRRRSSAMESEDSMGW